MTIIESLKNLIGYNGNDLDMVFAIIGTFIVIYFVSTLFNILFSVFRR